MAARFAGRCRHFEVWCHRCDPLRGFGVDVVQSVQVLDRDAADVREQPLNDEPGAGYGILSGCAVPQAQLRVGRRRARRAAAERWFPNQIGRRDHAGHSLLAVPCADPCEMAMDILRHVPDVEVIAPDELRGEVADFNSNDLVLRVFAPVITGAAPALPQPPCTTAALARRLGKRAFSVVKRVSR